MNHTPALKNGLFVAQGTTTNGDFLLPFKTGAFLAGVPLRPVILKYDTVRVSTFTASVAGYSFCLCCETLIFCGVDDTGTIEYISRKPASTLSQSQVP